LGVRDNPYQLTPNRGLTARANADGMIQIARYVTKKL
jgi:hypothetical protein